MSTDCFDVARTEVMWERHKNERLHDSVRFACIYHVSSGMWVLALCYNTNINHRTNYKEKVAFYRLTCYDNVIPLSFCLIAVVRIIY